MDLSFYTNVRLISFFYFRCSQSPDSGTQLCMKKNDEIMLSSLGFKKIISGWPSTIINPSHSNIVKFVTSSKSLMSIQNLKKRIDNKNTKSLMWFIDKYCDLIMYLSMRKDLNRNVYFTYGSLSASCAIYLRDTTWTNILKIPLLKWANYYSVLSSWSYP